MTKEYIDSLVSKRLKDLDIEYVFDKKYDVLFDFNSKYPSVNSKNIIDIPVWDLIKNIIYFKTDIWSDFDEVSKKIDSFCHAFDTLERDDLIATFSFIEDLRRCNDDGMVSKYLLEKSKIKEIFFMKTLRSRIDIADDFFVELLTSFKANLIKSNIDIDAYLDFFFSNDENYMIVKNLMYLYLYYVDYVENMDAMEDARNTCKELAVGLNASVRKKRLESTLTSELINRYELKNIFSYLDEINTFLRGCEKEEKRFKKELSKERDFLISAIEKLEKDLKNDEISDAGFYAKMIKNPEIRCAVLEFIYEHNCIYCSNLNEYLAKLNKNSKVQYQALLKEFDFEVDDLAIESIMNNDIDDVKLMLGFLIRVLNFNQDVSFEILKVSNLDRINSIRELSVKGVLSPAFLRINTTLFDLGDNSYNILMSNIELINSYNLNPSIFYNSIYVLLNSSELLKKNLDYLVEYDLLKYIKTTSNYNFLLSNDLVTSIDKILELGYEKFLKCNLGILNYNTINRLYVLKELNVPVDSIEDFEKVLTEKFYVDDNSVEECLYNCLPYRKEIDLFMEPSELNNFKNTNRTYSFGGINVSINKVKRLLDEGKSLYNAIFYGMILNDDEYETVIDTLKPYTYKKN